MKANLLKKLSLALVLTLGVTAMSGCQSAPAEKAESTTAEQTTVEQTTAVVEEPVGTNIGSFTAIDMAGNEVNQDVFAEHKLTMVNVFSVG